MRPPLQTAWTSSADLALIRAGASGLYGVTGIGKVVSLDPATGAVKWMTTTTYLRHRITVSGNKVFAYRKDEGLAVITDSGTTFSERLIIGKTPLTEAEPVSNVVFRADRIYVAVDEALLVLTEAGSFVAGTSCGNQDPHVLVMASDTRCIVVDGYGQPQLFELSGSSLTRRWFTTLPDPGTVRRERPVLLESGLLITGANGRTVAYDAATGAIRWENTSVAAQAFTLVGSTLYAVGPAGEVWALNVSTGAATWRRMYQYTTTQMDRVGVVHSDGHLFIGAFVSGGGPIHLYAVDTSTGAMVWQGNTMASATTMGLPFIHGHYLIPYGTSQPAMAMTAVAAPRIGPSAFSWSPNPLRGARSGFSGTLSMNLPVRATLTVHALRETQGFGARLLNQVQQGPGQSTINWDAGGTGGFTDANQFGRLQIEVREDGGPTYTVTKLVPVNTLPDLLGHWAQSNVEAMIYHRYIGGYPDQTFKPDNNVTRAETCVIVAQTLGLTGPSAGFRSSLTDIGSHWARNHIMALEERGVISGFREADGTFTFRPELNMTRAQEARVFVRAYEISLAPPGFSSRFTDTAGHWARADIEALEAAGYITGFREPDGTFTYRPEQSLTRAELCTVVVRILRLSR